MKRRVLLEASLLSLVPVMNAHALTLKDLIFLKEFIKLVAVVAVTEGTSSAVRAAGQILRPDVNSFESAKALEIIEALTNPTVTTDRLLSVFAPKVDYMKIGIVTAEELVNIMMNLRDFYGSPISYKKPSIDNLEVLSDRKFTAVSYEFAQTFKNPAGKIWQVKDDRVALLGDLQSGGRVYAIKSTRQ